MSNDSTLFANLEQTDVIQSIAVFDSVVNIDVKVEDIADLMDSEVLQHLKEEEEERT